jgi:hypothetical protein
MVMPILNQSNLTSKQLDQLILFLNRHRDSLRENDVFVEAARYEHLMFKRLFHELATETYLPRKSAEEIFGDDLPKSILVMRELIDFCFYGTNSEEIDQVIEEMANQNTEIAKATKKARAAVKESANPETLNSMILGPILLGTFQTMTKADYEDEMEVLVTRYHQIEAASQLPFPESTRALLELQDNWTTDGSWKSTKVLKWFSPHKKLNSVRLRRHLRINSLLCMAAVRKWQLDHDGRNPADLGVALAAASVKRPPVDPHSGRGLKIQVGDKVLIYSVGPDGKDDQAKRQIDYWVTSSEEKGDIVFELSPLRPR